MNSAEVRVWTQQSGWVGASTDVVRATDRGFLYGQGVFETFRSRHGKFFRLERHLARMCNSAAGLEISPPDLDRVLDALKDGLQQFEGADIIFRISLTPGSGWPSPDKGNTASCVILARPVAEMSVNPIRLAVSRYSRQTGSVSSGRKTLNYLESALSLDEAKKQGFDDSILLDRSGRVSETSVSNLFFIHNSRLYTPALFTGALPGIMREEVLKLGDKLGIRTFQGGYPLEKILRSDAVFVTNSVIGVKPVSQAATLTLPAASANEIFSAIKINLAEVIDAEAKTVEDIRHGIRELL